MQQQIVKRFFMLLSISHLNMAKIVQILRKHRPHICAKFERNEAYFYVVQNSSKAV